MGRKRRLYGLNESACCHSHCRAGVALPSSVCQWVRGHDRDSVSDHEPGEPLIALHALACGGVPTREDHHGHPTVAILRAARVGRDVKRRPALEDDPLDPELSVLDPAEPSGTERCAGRKRPPHAFELVLTRRRNASKCSTDSRAASLEALCSSSRRRYSLLYSHNIEPKPDWPEALESVPPAVRMASSRRVIKILATVPDDTPAHVWKVPRGAPSFDGGGHGLADPSAPVDKSRHGCDRFRRIAMLPDLASENDP